MNDQRKVLDLGAADLWSQSAKGKRGNTAGVTIRYVQYDGDGQWVDVTLSTGNTYRLDASWLVRHIVDAVHHHDKHVGLVTGVGVLRWGEEDAEKV